MRPKIASNVDVGLDNSNGQLHFIFVNSREELVLDADPITVNLIDLMDGTKSVPELAKTIENEVAESEILDLIEFLREQRIVMDTNNYQSLPKSMALFERQIDFFTDFAEDPIKIQEKICNCRVGIVGLGTIGGMIASQLCRMGIGGIYAIDAETVEASNLARHALFTFEDIGNNKIDAAGRCLKAIRPGLEYNCKQMFISKEEDVTDLASDCDLVINCSDQPSVAQTSEWVGRACMKTETPHILAGGYRTHLGFLGPTIVPFESACWKCFADDYTVNDPFGKLGWQPLASSRVSGGSLMPLAGMIASIHAWEAVRLLSGLLPPIMENRKAEINYVDMAITWYEVGRNPQCPVCGG